LQQVVIGMGAPTSAQFIIQAAIILLGMSIRVAPWRLALDLLRRHRRTEASRGQAATVER
jgi:hypothetical protein